MTNKVQVKIEIPLGSRVKYEANKFTGVIEVDRILSAPVPYNYGYVPSTLWEDGDPLDAIVIGDFSLHPGVELRANPVALIKMWDNGESDFKLVCSFTTEPISDWLKIITDFLSTYKPGIVIADVTTDIKDILETISIAEKCYKTEGGS